MAEPRRSRGWIGEGVAIAIATLASLVLLPTSGCETTIAAVRSSADDAGPDGPLLFALVGFALVASIGWLVRGRARPWPLLALAPAIALIAWFAGAHRLQTAAARATPQLGLGDRISELLMALGLGADVWMLGGLTASAVLVAASLMFALRARGYADRLVTDGRRVLSFVLGASALAAVVVVLFSVRNFGAYSRWDRVHAFLALVPSAFGVVAIYLGAGAMRGGPRAEVSRELTRSAVTSFFAVLTIGPACMLGNGADIGESSIGPEIIARVMVDLDAELRWLFVYVLLFGVPILVALAVAIGRPRAHGIGLVLWPSVATLVLVCAGYARFWRVTQEIGSLPRGVTSVPLAMGSADACAGLPTSRLVHVSASGVVGQGLDVRFEDDGTCSAPAAAIDRLAKTEAAWLEVDPLTPFSRVGCLMDELARARGARGLGAQGGSRITPICSLHFVGRRDGATVCKEVVFADLRCRSNSLDETPDKVMEVALEAPPTLTWTQYATTVSSRTLPAGHPLVDEVRLDWTLHGVHRDPADARFDLVIVRGTPSASFEDVATHIGSLDTITRPRNRRWANPLEVPVFDVAIASMDFRRLVVTDAMLPPFSIPTKGISQPSENKRTFETAQSMCQWGGCSRPVRARLLVGLAHSTTAKTLSPMSSIYLAQARALDPGVNLPLLAPSDAGAPGQGPDGLRPAKVEPQADVTITDAGGVDEPMLERFITESRGDLLACAIFSWGVRDDSRTRDVVVRVARDGHVVQARTDPPEGCVASALEHASFPPSSREARPTLRVTLTRAKY